MTDARLPQWDLTNVYAGLDAPEFSAGETRAARLLEDLDAYAATHRIGDRAAEPDVAEAAEVLAGLLDRLNAVLPLMQTLDAYAHSFVTTDSYNTAAAAAASRLELLELRAEKLITRLRVWAGVLAPLLPELAQRSPVIAEHRLTLEDEARRSRYLMGTELEDLAAELQLSGGGAMWKLQGTVVSQLKVPFERDGEMRPMPIAAVRALHSDPDEAVRRRAHEAELSAYASVRQPVAFALNCVKGAALTLARRRGLDDVLHDSLLRNQIDRPTLTAMWEAIRAELPAFRGYLQTKARRLGKERLAWWDLMAPVSAATPRYTWEEASAFIIEQFGRFSDDLAAFARTAFERRWIDAEPRDGKRGGAFCMRVPGVEESRILTNFDGSFDSMATVAHELGHGYHNECQRGMPALRRGAPMVLAETASIFCETLVFEAALATRPPAEQLGILENQLLGATQVTVDILSRFLFETEVLRRRERAELSADDFCELMLAAQREVYGDALDPEHLNPYMWVWKPHYYYEKQQFYNYPYAFGLLFGLGVYARYRAEGAAFLPRYRELLRATGAGPAADLARRFGIDIGSREFWAGSLNVLTGQIRRYAEL